MLISVVVPTCNRPDSLRLCLGRLAPGFQSLPPEQYEVIVTDDGRDEAAKLLLSKHFPWARWCPGPRRGPASNRNSGVRNSAGDWIAFTDDDCLPCPEWLASFADAIRSDANGSVLEGRTTCSSGPLTSPLEDAPVNLTGGRLWSCNFCIRRTLFETVGGFDQAFPIAYMEDVEFRERLLRLGETFAFIPDATVDHPIKRYNLGTDFGRYAESEAIYWYKQGNTGSLFGPYLWSLIKNRTHWAVLGNGRSASARDRLIASIIVLKELGYTASHLRKWETQYRKSGVP
ncbi:MAG: glycosyltransferase [Cytophagales bacterium]|nr:glycosyltransferase [Armatimonadota bacterium]